MRLITFMIAAAVAASPVLAQQTQRSSNPQGVQIQGNTNINAKNENVAAVAVGEGNTAKTTTGAIKVATIQEQTAQRLSNIRAILEEAGSSLDKVVSVTVVLADEDDFAGMNEE